MQQQIALFQETPFFVPTQEDREAVLGNLKKKAFANTPDGNAGICDNDCMCVDCEICHGDCTSDCVCDCDGQHDKIL